MWQNNGFEYGRGFFHPSEGEVRLAGKPVTRPGPDRAVVFQSPELFPWLIVKANVSFGPRLMGVPEKEYGVKVKEYLESVGLTGFENHYPYELSGGMQQRVAI